MKLYPMIKNLHYFLEVFEDGVLKIIVKVFYHNMPFETLKLLFIVDLQSNQVDQSWSNLLNSDKCS